MGFDKSQILAWQQNAARAAGVSPPKVRAKRGQGKAAKAKLAEAFDPFRAFCFQSSIKTPEKEYRFHETRKWRFDYAWPDYMVAVECEGGTYIAGGGGHNRGKAFRDDLEKYSESAAMGWLVIRVTPQQLCTAYTAALVKRAISVKGPA